VALTGYKDITALRFGGAFSKPVACEREKGGEWLVWAFYKYLTPPGFLLDFDDFDGMVAGNQSRLDYKR
jgi:hypothetical protein